jgi:hypothetical protein
MLLSRKSVDEVLNNAMQGQRKRGYNRLER